MSGGMADELWPLEEAVGEFLEGRGKWDEVDDNGAVALVIPAADVVKLMKAYENAMEAIREIEELENGDDETDLDED